MFSSSTIPLGLLIGCVFLVATMHAYSHHKTEKGRMSDPKNEGSDIIEINDDPIEDVVKAVMKEYANSHAASKGHIWRGKRETVGTTLYRVRRSRKCNLEWKRARAKLASCQSELKTKHSGYESQGQKEQNKGPADGLIGEDGSKESDPEQEKEEGTKEYDQNDEKEQGTTENGQDDTKEDWTKENGQDDAKEDWTKGNDQNGANEDWMKEYDKDGEKEEEE